MLTLATVVAVRVLAAGASGMWLWGVNLLRFLPVWTWLLTLAAAAALIPALGRRALPALRGAGERLAPGSAWVALAAFAGAVLVFALPDQVRSVGDFLLRQGTVEQTAQPGRLFPQALPLDVMLHYTLPAWMGSHLYLDPNLANRLLGALDAALLALLAVAFPRRLGAKGAEFATVAALIWWGGWLGLFTGYSKAFCELTLVMVATATFGLDAMRDGRRAMALALVVSAGLLLHRSAMALLPAAAIALWVASRHARAAAPRKAALAWAALVLPFVVAGLLAPRVVAAMRAFDLGHFMAPGSDAAGSAESLFTPLRLLDDLNLVLLLVPLAPLLPALLLARPSARVLAPREWWFLVVLAAPFIAVMFVLRPAQGLFRDYDDFAAGGIALALLLAVAVSAALRSAPRVAWLTAAVTLGCVTPSLQWLIHHTDVTRGLARLEAIAQGPPRRTDEERAKTWDYLGVRSLRTDRYAQAARSLEQAAALAPSPRIVMEWALAASRARDWPMAERAYRLLLERASMDSAEVRFRVAAMAGIAMLATRRGDIATADDYAHRVLAVQPDHVLAQRIVDYVEAETERRARGETTSVNIDLPPPGP